MNKLNKKALVSVGVQMVKLIGGGAFAGFAFTWIAIHQPMLLVVLALLGGVAYFAVVMYKIEVASQKTDTTVDDYVAILEDLRAKYPSAKIEEDAQRIEREKKNSQQN